MKVSSKNIKTIKARLERLYDEFNIGPLDKLDEPKIGDDSIFIDYPDDIIEEGISVEDFLDYTSDLDNLIKEDDSTVRMGRISQTIVSIDSYRYDYLVPVITYEDELLCLEVVSDPVLIGLIASKEGMYDEDFGISPCSLYTAVEFRYKSEDRYSKEQEGNLIKRFLYHIASKYDVSIEVSTFYTWDDITGEEKPEPYQLKVEELIPYSEAMEYYSNALRIFDRDIQFHHLYKIIEHFSPIVSKKMAYERLNQKLDSLSVVSRDYQYLDSLLDLAKHYEVSLKDKELCKTVLTECVDLVPIFGLLPEKVRGGILKRCSITEAELSKSSNQDIAKVKNDLGEVIYNTRNRIVHAKSNWGNSEKACEGDDMEEMNEFMKALAQCLIVWNGRQPKEYRV